MGTHGSILGLLGVAALQGQAVTLVLETLGGDQALDLGGLGVWLLALTLGLDFTTDDELADLENTKKKTVSTSSWLGIVKVAHTLQFWLHVQPVASVPPTRGSAGQRRSGSEKSRR